MAYRSSRSLAVIGGDCRCCGLVLLLAFALTGCKSSSQDIPGPKVGQETDFAVLVSPEREVDILFMVDNSPGMEAKQKALVDGFPKLIQQLQQLPDGLPDLGGFQKTWQIGGHRVTRNSATRL
jgi:hypothetical protein